MDQESSQKLFSEALRDNNADTILSLLENGDIDENYRDIAHDLATPLMRICHSNLDETQLKEMLKVTDTKTIDLNLVDALGRSLAVHACIARRPSVLEFSIAKNCNVLIADKNGKNLVHHAACSGSDEIVDIILKHPDIVKALKTLDFQGNSPIDLARQRKFNTVARKLGDLLKNTKKPETESLNTNNALGWPDFQTPTQRPFQPLSQSEAPWLQENAISAKHQQLGSLEGVLPNEANYSKEGLLTDLSNNTHNSKALSQPDTLASSNNLVTPRRHGNALNLQPLNAEEITQGSENFLSPRQRSRNRPRKIQADIFDESIPEHVSSNKQVPAYNNLRKPDFPRQNNVENNETLTTPTDVIFGAKNSDRQSPNHTSVFPRTDKSVLSDISSTPRNPTTRQRLTAYSLPGQLGNRQEQVASEPNTNPIFKRNHLSTNPSTTQQIQRPARVPINVESKTFETLGKNENTSNRQNPSFLTPSPRLKDRDTLLHKRQERSDLAMKQVNKSYVFESTEEDNCVFEEEIFLPTGQRYTPTHLSNKKNQKDQRTGEGLSSQNENEAGNRLRERRSSISLPDLRDMGEFLVSSKEKSLLQMLAHDKNLRKAGNFDDDDKSSYTGVKIRKTKKTPRSENECGYDDEIDGKAKDSGDIVRINCNGTDSGLHSERRPNHRTLPSLNSFGEKNNREGKS